MILAGFLAHAAPAHAKNSLKFHRWNPGFRVEAEVAQEVEGSEAELEAILQAPEMIAGLPEAKIYPGCYAVEKNLDARTPASQSEEKAPAVYRVCFSAN